MTADRSSTHDIAIVALTESGAQIARRIAPELPGARVHALARRVADCDVAFDDTMAHLAGLYRAGIPIVGVCAAGILIRALAGNLSDKWAEPPVVALAEDGSSAVPLLGGHRGANGLARRIAALTGGTAALTTAGDLAGLPALDDPPPGWRLANPEVAKPFIAAHLAGATGRLVVEAGDAGWLASLEGPDKAGGAGWSVRVTDRAAEAGERELVIHPPTLALGVGCERGCDPAELAGLVEETLATAGLARESVALVTSLDLKSDERAVLDLADALGVEARFFDAAQLEAETPRLATPSDVVFREVGTHGVAEAAALAAGGPDATLVVAKRKSPRATCAIARARAIDPARSGRPRGRLVILGTGPGDSAWRIPAADAAVRNADALVGYGLYLDLLGPLAAGKERHEFDLGAEETRCRHALDLAAAGRNVALVSSGDPGIYAMATLVFELIDREDRPDWRRIDVEVLPGVSAMQLAAARAGAPLGHDFCAISLSDLLTPWPAIEGRLRAAAAGDFVVALYNPASRRRRTQLVAARDILMAARPGDTPVILARNLGRPSEAVTTTTLAAMDPDAVDMLTVVIIGSSHSRMLDLGGTPRTYTPRGYLSAADQPPKTGTAT